MPSFAPAQPAKAAVATVVEADRTEYSAPTGETILQGNARLSDGTLLLLADEIRSNQTTGVVTASGNIVFTRGELRLLADRLSYTRPTESFTAENIRLGSHPYLVEGTSASGTREEIVIKHARATYGEPGPWQPTITADTIIFSPGQQLRSENASIGIGHTQPLPVPRFDHKLGAPFLGAVALTGGFRRSLGVFVDASVHVPVRAGLRLGADLGVYTGRGVMIGPSGRYSNSEHPEALSGYFRSGYINDHGDKKTDILGRPIPEERAYFEWQHQQQVADRLTLNTQFNWWKDSEVLRDFRPRVFFPVQEPDTFAEAIHTGENFFVSAFLRFQPNRYHAVQERLPEFRFDLLPLALGNGFYQRFNASAVMLREDLLPLPPGSVTAVASAFLPSGVPVRVVVTTNRPTVPIPPGVLATALVPPAPPPTRLRSHRLNAYYALSRPFAPQEWLAITPLVGGQATHYVNTEIGGVKSDNYLRLLGEIGGDVALRASGTFDYKNPQWKIDGLRHLVTPRVSYRYIPDGDRGRDRITPIDRRAFSTYLPPLGLGDQRNIDDLRATSTLRLSFDNILQTRDTAEGTRNLIAFNVANDFRFKRAPGERDVSAVHTELSVMPARWIQFDLYQSLVPQNFRTQELNSSLTLRDGRAWTLRFGNNFLRQQLQDYSTDLRYRINERFEGLTRLRYDARKHRFNEQAYGVVQNLGNTWLISYTVSIYSGRKRESNFGLNVQIDTVRF
ncbi:MAG: LPS-assembly protein LptD [Opitutus sp.]|nr:LPS-assembly protein LptD [Opitutus sp.]